MVNVGVAIESRCSGVRAVYGVSNGVENGVESKSQSKYKVNIK